MIPLFYPQLFKEEWLAELSKIFDTQWIGQGPKVDEFESEFGKKFNYDYCLAVNSGTSSLELAYHLIGIGEGDEVITTVFTCTATNIPLLRRKATIVFADINDDLLISYEDIKRKITDKTKAIVVVSLGGLPVDRRIFDLGLPVVVDSAQSLGVRENDGDYICYSFQAIKHFTTGDGGMLVVKDKDTYDRAKKLRWFGIDRDAKRRVGFNALVNHKTSMEIEESGYKFHMNDIAATMGLVGLRHNDEILKRRHEICQYYADNLKARCVWGGSCWLFGLLTEDRDDLVTYLREVGISTDLIQLRNDIFQVFGGARQDLPNMNRIEAQYMYLPVHDKLSNGDLEFIVDTFNRRKS